MIRQLDQRDGTANGYGRRDDAADAVRAELVHRQSPELSGASDRAPADSRPERSGEPNRRSVTVTDE